MNGRRFVAGIAALSLLVGSFAGVSTSVAQPADSPEPSAPSSDVTPSRLSYLHGDVSFWRPGAPDWAPAKLNVALAPGDALYTDRNGNAEIQIGPRAFVRAAESTQIGLDNQEPQFLQFRVTTGHVALDLRELSPGQSIELATPNAAFTIEHPGYYRVDVVGDSVSFATHRGGRAILTAADGPDTPIDPNRQAVVVGTDPPRVEMREAPVLAAWDTWNEQRSAYVLQSASARYVPPGVYGTHELDTHGTWRDTDTYGAVWVPRAVPAGWVPYSSGRWIWDPIYGWTWLDDAPWGWAPYHYGRWVYVGNHWGWAPGPVRVRPVYSPALVVFLGGVTVSVGRPVAWAPLGWGEPLVPWWGRRGFVGVPTWRGWGGPRVVNNVVVNNVTNVNVTNINVYRNVNVVNAVVGVPEERFGRERVPPTRLSRPDVERLAPVRGALAARPTPVSVLPATGPAPRPPAAIQERRIVATRPPQDVTPVLRDQGLTDSSGPAVRRAAPRLVPSPRAAVTPGRPGDDDRRPGAAVTPGRPGDDDRKAATPGRAGDADRRPGAAATPGRPGDDDRRPSSIAPGRAGDDDRRTPSATTPQPPVTAPQPPVTGSQPPVTSPQPRVTTPQPPATAPQPAPPQPQVRTPRDATSPPGQRPETPPGQRPETSPPRSDRPGRAEPLGPGPAPTPAPPAMTRPSREGPQTAPPATAPTPAPPSGRLGTPGRDDRPEPPGRVERPGRSDAPGIGTPPPRPTSPPSSAPPPQGGPSREAPPRGPRGDGRQSSFGAPARVDPPAREAPPSRPPSPTPASPAREASPRPARVESAPPRVERAPRVEQPARPQRPEQPQPAPQVERPGRGGGKDGGPPSQPGKRD